VNKIFSVRVAICGLWLILAVAGFALVLNYQNTPGVEGKFSDAWPVGTTLKLNTNGATLVMFVHPQCPCSRSTIEELNRLLARIQNKASVQVCFFQPDGLPAEWSRSGLWSSAAAIPGVVSQQDVGGRQALLFGAETSGSVFLYNPEGQLVFKGGITAGRGHAGDNSGANAIAALLSGTPVPLQQTPVFGCSLRGCEMDKSATP
jgi:hypothetical protein